jgi:hypothetical protein
MIYTLDQQYEIFNYYFGPVELKKSFKNPLRNDKTPKCYFTERNDTLFFMDWAFMPTHLDCIEFVNKQYNLNDRKSSINKINLDLKYSNKVKGNFLSQVQGELQKAPLLTLDKVTNTLEKSNYSVITKSFNNIELNYWNQFQINLDILNKFEIKPIQYVLKNNIINYSASNFNPIFGYYENNELFKIYNPIGKSFQKWRTIKAILEGYSKLEYKTNICFITSSLKDTMCLTALGYDAFNLPSENSYKIFLPVIEDLFSKFEAIYVYLNNDEAGKKFSRLLTLEIDTRLKYINNPSFMQEKDPSDVIKFLGSNRLLEIINERLLRDQITLKIK